MKLKFIFHQNRHIACTNNNLFFVLKIIIFFCFSPTPFVLINYTEHIMAVAVLQKYNRWRLSQFRI